MNNDYRMIWQYLVDTCSHAGIWKKDFRGLNFNCNTNITEDEFKNVFGSRVIEFEKYYFIPKFLLFQYPSGLNSKKPAIVSVRKELRLNNLINTVRELFGNDYLIIKDKDKDKDKDNSEVEVIQEAVPADFNPEFPSEILQRNEQLWLSLDRTARSVGVDFDYCVSDWDGWYVNKFTDWKSDWARGKLPDGALFKGLKNWITDPRSKKKSLKPTHSNPGKF